MKNKMFQKYKKKIAILMLLMVLMLPIYSSIALADLISIEARGQDNLVNIIRQDDFVVFKASATIVGDSEITPNQLILGSDKEFDACSVGISGFDCESRFPENGTRAFEAQAIPYTITLKDDNGIVVDTKISSMFVDNLAPTITSFKIDEVASSSGTIKIIFSVEDKACNDASCKEVCSGIDRLELSDNDFQQTIAIETDSCVFSDTVEISTLPLSEGQHVIIANAFDKVNQISTAKSATFEIDKTGPSIDLNSFRVTDETNLDMEFFGVNPVPVTVKVDITDPNLDKSSVVADLSELGGRQNMLASCGQTDSDTSTCSWNLNLNINNAGLKTVTIKTTDSFGNKANATTTRNFELDNNGPVALSLASSRVFDGQSFAKLTGNKFIATFSEDKVGLKPSDMKLHANNAVTVAESCTQAFDLWQCTWNNINFNNAGKTSVFVGTDSTDRLRNSVATKLEEEVIVDNTKPRLVDLIITGIGGTEGTIEDVIKTGDKINVRAVLEDDSIETAIADFSRFVFNAGNVSADECVATGSDAFVCSWTTSSIDIEGFISDSVKLEFIDVAGNTLTVSEQLIVFGVSGEETPDFWESSVSCSPTLLDRETFPLVNQRAFCQVFLKPKSLVDDLARFEGVTPLSISLRNCQGDTNFVDSFELLNNDIGSTEPIIRVNFRKQDARVDEIDLLCALEIISKKNIEVFTIPETENINFSFAFYNLPLGELSESVEKKIDDAVNDADNILKVATFFKKVLFYAERICQFGNIIANVVGSFKLLGAFLANAEFNGAPVTAQRIATDITTENIRQEGLKIFPDFVSKFCGWVNCKPTFDPDGEVGFTFGGVTAVLGQWEQSGRNFINNVLGGNLVGKYTGDPVTGVRPIETYMNPKNSIVVATLTACIPGIIYGLDKYRQIQCMYADCLQTGVGKQGLPVFACEDQKNYATCKYVVGEVFQVIPFTAIFDYYMNLLKSTLANPFKILGASISAACNPTIFPTNPLGYDICAGAKVISFIGVTVNEVTSIFEQGIFTIRDDFCDRLDFDESEDNEGTNTEEDI